MSFNVNKRTSLLESIKDEDKAFKNGDRDCKFNSTVKQSPTPKGSRYEKASPFIAS